MTNNDNTSVTRTTPDISLLSRQDLESAAAMGILGAKMGLPLDTLPPATEIATWDDGNTVEWAEQYRNVAIHCYNSYKAEQQGDPLAELLSILTGGGLAENDNELLDSVLTGA